MPQVIFLTSIGRLFIVIFACTFLKVYFAEPVAQDTDVKISYQTKEKPTYEQNPRVWANIKKGKK